MTSHGGPVQNDPKVYLVFWDWTSDPSGEAPYLERFLSAAGGTPWLSVVSQYNAFEHGGMLAGVFSDPSPIPPHVTAADVQAEALNAARHFGIGPSVNVQVVVATPTGNYPLGFGTRTADFPEGYCAYHSTFSDTYTSMPYTLLPYMTDAIAIGADCGQNSVNGSAGLLDGVSIAEGHELAETITDPLIDGWYANSISGEIGDLCVGNSGNITTVAGIFPVQALWSNAANGCVRDASNDPIGTASFETALNTGNLDMQTVGYDDIDWQLGVSLGTSPAITPVPAGGFVAAFQGTNYDLWTVGASAPKDSGLAMMGGTSPAVASLLTGGYEAAFEGANGHLWVTGTYGTFELGVAMMPGTSPAITSTLDAGGDGDGHEFMVAFEGINGDLYTFGKNSPAADTGYAMAQASSPSITELFNGQYEIVFEANSTLLWAVGAYNIGAMGYGMARYTSPAITTLPNGTLEVAFQANTSSLWTIGTDNHGAWNLGMATHTSPAITPLPDGGYEVAFQANTSSLWTVGSYNQARNLGLAVGTSPSIAW
jgi:hypothetical protein